MNDRLLGRVPFSGTLAPGDSYTQSLQAAIPPVGPGQYRVIVRPDIFDEVYEGANESNNRTTSPDAINVTVDSLVLGAPLDTTLKTGQERLYQLTVGPGQTLKVDLTSSAAASNEIFIRFGAAIGEAQ